MTPAPAIPVAQLFAIQLIPTDMPTRNGIVGRLEHVPSGRTHEFHSGTALLAFLAFEQSRIASFEALLSTVRVSST